MMRTEYVIRIIHEMNHAHTNTPSLTIDEMDFRQRDTLAFFAIVFRIHRTDSNWFDFVAFQKEFHFLYALTNAFAVIVSWYSFGLATHLCSSLCSSLCSFAHCTLFVRTKETFGMKIFRSRKLKQCMFVLVTFPKAEPMHSNGWSIDPVCDNQTLLTLVSPRSIFQFEMKWNQTRKYIEFIAFNSSPFHRFADIGIAVKAFFLNLSLSFIQFCQCKCQLSRWTNIYISKLVYLFFVSYLPLCCSPFDNLFYWCRMKHANRNFLVHLPRNWAQKCHHVTIEKKRKNRIALNRAKWFACRHVSSVSIP